MPFLVIILSYWHIILWCKIISSLLRCNIISLNCFARSQQHRTSTGTQFPSLKIIINRNFSRMADQSSFSNCKSATPTKPTSSNTIHHANPFTNLIQDINHKRNVKKSWNCSLFCTGLLPHSTAAVSSEQDLTKHMDPTHFLSNMWEWNMKLSKLLLITKRILIYHQRKSSSTSLLTWLLVVKKSTTVLLSLIAVGNTW